MPDESDPPRKIYQLKATSFERLNDPPTAPKDGEPASESPQATPASQRIDVRDLARQATQGVPLRGAKSSTAKRENEVHAMLRENLAAADAAGINDIKPTPKRRSRRKRDYWGVMLSVNAFFLFWIFGPYANPMTFVYGVAGIILFTAGFTWVMFGVLDDY